MRRTERACLLVLPVHVGAGLCDCSPAYSLRSLGSPFSIHLTRWIPLLTPKRAGLTICLWQWQIISSVSGLPLEFTSITISETRGYCWRIYFKVLAVLFLA